MFLKNMTVFNMILMEEEGGGGEGEGGEWGEGRCNDAVDVVGEGEGEEGEGEVAATEKKFRKCCDMIGR